FLDNVPERGMQLVVAKLIGRREGKLGRKPLADGENGGFLPSEHGSEEFVFDGRGNLVLIQAEYGLVEIRLELVAQLGIAQQMIRNAQNWVGNKTTWGGTPQTYRFSGSKVEGNSSAARAIFMALCGKPDVH